MAPIIVNRVLNPFIWCASDLSQPKLSRRDGSFSGFNHGTFIVPISIALFIVIVFIALRVQRARARHRARLHPHVPVSFPRNPGVPTRTRRATVPQPTSEDVLDPPPPYVPLQTLAPAYKPTDPENLERPADIERNVGNQGQARSMLDV